MTRALVLAVPVLLTACTYGQVQWGGEPMPNAIVEFQNCDGRTWTATTNDQGWYLFDGHEHAHEHIPDDVYLVSVDLAAGPTRYEMVPVTYEPCPAPHASQLCFRRDIDFGFRPLTGWESNAFYDQLNQHNDLTRYSFHAELCRWL